MKLFEMKVDGHSWINGRIDYRTPGRIDKLYCSLRGDDLALFRRVCASLPCPKQFMTEHKEDFGWDNEMIANARFFTPRPLPTPVSYFPKSWHCYENCYLKARAEGIYYVEGLMICPCGPIIHAWNSTDGKNVIDLGQPFQHLNKYFGMIFDTRPEIGHRDCLAGTFGRFQQFALKKLAERSRP